MNRDDPVQQPDSKLLRLMHTPKDPEQLHLYSLVLSAADISHRVEPQNNNSFIIFVESKDLERATAEIDAYDRENANWPQSPPEPDSFSPYFHAHSLLIIGCLVLFYSVTGDWSAQSQWFSNGAVDSSAIIARGEYQRLITALTLHADIVHLLGNSFLGGFLLHFYFQLLGNGIGFASLLAASAAANYLNVIGHGQGHLSVGFSTAVFSIIGILSALNYRHYKFSRPGRLLLPLMAGVTMLAMLGSSGERTDLGAHFYGLVTGLAAGTVLGIRPVLALRDRFWLQLTLAIASWLLPLLAWSVALD